MEKDPEKDLTGNCIYFTPEQSELLLPLIELADSAAGAAESAMILAERRKRTMWLAVRDALKLDDNHDYTFVAGYTGVIVIRGEHKEMWDECRTLEDWLKRHSSEKPPSKHGLTPKSAVESGISPAATNE
jgi:hypothetical protein